MTSQTNTPKKTTRQLKSEKFILTSTDGTACFPAIEGTRQLTSRIDQTYVFDGRDNPDYKVGYYNALYKSTGVQFTAYHFTA